MALHDERRHVDAAAFEIEVMALDAIIRARFINGFARLEVGKPRAPARPQPVRKSAWQ